jgi:hypothetical protein
MKPPIIPMKMACAEKTASCMPDYAEIVAKIEKDKKTGT